MHKGTIQVAVLLEKEHLLRKNISNQFFFSKKLVRSRVNALLPDPWQSHRGKGAISSNAKGGIRTQLRKNRMYRKYLRMSREILNKICRNFFYFDLYGDQFKDEIFFIYVCFKLNVTFHKCFKKYNF